MSRFAVLSAIALLAACNAGDGTSSHMKQESDVTTPAKRKNRLANEKSPYLLQHADNPVDWYPWGEEAFEKAKKENKPIFLSIGYSTCHWCHVMEHESFENAETADVMNKHFVSIKVDREERPDVDAIYMAALTQAMGQHGGWPLNVWLTPDLKPFFGGTYFPPEDGFGRPPFKRVLLDIADLWEKKPKEIRERAGAVADFLKQGGDAAAEGELKIDHFLAALAAFDRIFDDTHGGFGHAPKFPQPALAEFLLRHHARTGDKRGLEMVESQLLHMADGGIYDHLGGGFARYSTDERWLVPHFEKMLYDNAQLLRLYAETFRLARRPEYERVIRETAEYVMRDMTDPQGGFTSAEDADSEGVEGRFYVWRRKEVEGILGGDAKFFCLAYDVTEDGNWEDAHFDTRGLNILNRRLTSEQIAKLEKRGVEEVERILTAARKKLFDVRAKRVRPGLDDKVLTSWNGLMIGALAYAGATLEERRYVDAARRAAEFVTTALLRDGALLHRYRKGEAGLDGLLEDYAFLVAGLLDLYEATLEERWLRLARDLNAKAIELFHDAEKGGFFTAQAGKSDLIARRKDIDDGALPSPGNVAVVNLVRLGEITGDASLRKRAEATLKLYAGHLDQRPVVCPNLLIALDWLQGPSRQIVLADDGSRMLGVLNRRFLPRTVIVHSRVDAKLSPMVEGKKSIDGKPTAYVCENYACKLPVTDPEELEKQIR